MAKASPNFYAILGVSPKASPEDLRAAYTRLAKKYHPDLNPDKPQIEELFKSVTEAYAVLRDPETRARYDRLRAKLYAKKTRPSSSQTQSKPASSPKSGPKSGPEAQKEPVKNQAGPPPPKTPQTKPTADASANRQKTFNKPTSEPDLSAFEREKEKAAAREAVSQVENFVDQILKSRPGKVSLGQIQEELNKVGLGVSAERLSRQDPTRAKSLFSRAKQIFNSIFLKTATETSPYDISYRLALSQKAAALGATVSINYLRDHNQTQRLSVHIPPGVKDQSKLRLSGQGHLGPNQKRGDLILTLSIMG
ncbi:MAG: DnaJ domain-containing protein [Deltaproteobacteria bacterium]|jgi:curved DNA-binding protein CbpA|nr:DnaJ domain-containing protein [Deltaproteobacteria bacterium]